MAKQEVDEELEQYIPLGTTNLSGELEGRRFECGRQRRRALTDVESVDEIDLD